MGPRFGALKQWQLRITLAAATAQVALDKSEGVVKTEISWAVREPAFSPEKVEDQDSGNLT
jgi:hypothetical protein